MNSDKVKKIGLISSVILAVILFFCLYYINITKINSEDGQALEAPKTINASSRFVENKSIYSDYNSGEITKAYITVFPTTDKAGNCNDFSSFNLLANWNDEENPLLDANIQFVKGDKEFVEYQARTANSTIRVRGDRSNPLKSYRVKLMEGIKSLGGQAVFNIDKNSGDPSRIANKLAHDIIIDIDNISGFRTNFLKIYIKDGSLDTDERIFNSYGLYTHTEQPNKTYLRSRGLDDKGSLYYAENFRFQLAPELKSRDDDDYDKQSFETVLRIREGKEHTKLLRMLEDINDESKDFKTVFNTYFNEENYLTWLGINVLLGNSGAISNGFLIYNPSNSSVWYFMPWDFDGIFKWMEDDTEDYPSFIEQMGDVVLHKRYMEEEGSLDKLKDKIDQLIRGPFSKKNVKRIRKSYKPILYEIMNQYPDNVLSDFSLNEYFTYIDLIDERILINHEEFVEFYENKSLDGR